MSVERGVTAYPGFMVLLSVALTKLPTRTKQVGGYLLLFVGVCGKHARVMLDVGKRLIEMVE
jgi:hypothetical protein